MGISEFLSSSRPKAQERASWNLPALGLLPLTWTPGGSCQAPQARGAPESLLPALVGGCRGF